MTPALLLVLLPLAQAAPAAWYSPDEVAAQSQVFAQSADALAPHFDEVQQQLARFGRGVEALDANLAMHGAVAPAELRYWSAKTRRSLTGQYMQIQRHVDLLQEDMSNTFGSALERQLKALAGQYDIKECARSGLGAMMGPNRSAGRSGGNCEGEDLNARLGKALDADAGLRKAAEEIAAIPWPGVGAEPHSEAPVSLTGTATWVDAHRISRTFADAALDRRREALEDALAPMEDELDAGEAKAVAEGQRLREAYEAGLAKDGEALRSALTGALERAAKKGGPKGVGLCLVPHELGSCEGQDVTAQVLPLLEGDRKFINELGDLR